MWKDPKTNLCMSVSAKPISLVERCYCRSTVSNLPRGYIRELRFIHTPNCPFQVMWVWALQWATAAQNHTSPFWHETIREVFSLLDISHHQSPQDGRPEKRNVCTRTPLCHFHTHARGESTVAFISRPKEAFPGSESVECGKKKSGFLKLDSLTVLI